MQTRPGSGIRIAYLSTIYPGVSHTFIEREVRALRAQDVEVDTFSVRSPGHADLLSEDNRIAASSTTYILGDPLGLFTATVCALFLRPRRFFGTLFRGQAISPPGIKARALHCAYFIESLYLARVMNKRGLDHVHVHFANNGAVVALLARSFDPGITFSLTIHGPLEFFDVAYMRIGIKARDAAFVRCISHFCRAQVMMWTDPEIWDRLFIAHCGIDSTRFPPKPTNTNSGRPLEILALGRLAAMKGFHVLLEACASLEFEWSLDILGDGPFRSTLEQSAERLGIAANVHFRGAVGQDDLDAYLNRADVFVSSSFLEGLPVVLMEAMSKELAVVATRVAGIPELVQDGVNGLLVNPGDAESLAEALTRLARDPDLRLALGHTARKKVLAEFTVEETARTMIGAFRRVITGGSS